MCGVVKPIVYRFTPIEVDKIVVHGGQIMLLVEVVSHIATQHADGVATAFNRGISDKRQLLFKMTAFNIPAKHAEQIVVFRIAKDSGS